MSKIAFAKKTPIVIKVWVAEPKTASSTYIGEQRFVWMDGQASPSVPTSQPELLEFSFRWPTWKDDVSVQDNAMEIVDRSVRINASKLRKNRFQQLLQSWNIVDENGVVIPVSTETIDELDPDIANAIMDRLDEILGK